MRRTIFALAGLAVIGSLGGIASADTLVHFTFTIAENGVPTPLDVYADIYAKPGVTSTNFLNLVNSGAYANSMINFSVPGVVLQGGAYKFDSPADWMNTFDTVPNFGTIPLQYGLPNVRGTIAMDYNINPNSATSAFFINLTDNSAALGPSSTSSGYAVFGSVLNAASMSNVDTMGAIPTYNASGNIPDYAASFKNLPLTTGYFDYPNFVMLTSASVVGEMGDMNHDGVVNIDDALAFDHAYLHPSGTLIPNDYAVDWANGDFNLDGTVDGTDASILAAAIKQDAGVTLSASDILGEFPLGASPVAVPEPGTLAVIGLGAALLLRRRTGR